MSRILVVDDMAMIREPVVAALKAKGYDAVGVPSGEEAMAYLESAGADVILLDLVMPGMDGIATLEAVRRLPGHENTRVILLTASSDRECIIHAAKLGVRDYLLKSCFIMKDLLDRLNKYAGPAAPPAVSGGHGGTSRAAATEYAAPAGQDEKSRQLRREVTLRRISDAQIKAMPGAVGELLSITNSPRCDLSDVAAVLKRDPVLSMRMLRIANSAAFASARARIGTIDEAVRHIGLREIHRVAASVGIFETFGGGGAGLDLLRTWQHSLAVGRLMETLAKSIEGCEAGLAYTIGLCHDLPDIMLHQYLPEESAAINKLVGAGTPRRQAEVEVLGMSYADTAKHWLPRLRLHSTISNPITAFFTAIASGRPEFHGEMLPALLHLSESYANAVMLGRCLQDGVGPITKLECHNIPGRLPALDPQEVRQDAISVLGLFGEFPAADVKSACDQPLPQSPVRVLYVRDGRFADFDPLHAALELLSERVTVVEDVRHLPPTMAAFDAVIEIDAQLPASVRKQLPVLQLLSGEGKRAAPNSGQALLPVPLKDVSAFLAQVEESMAAV